MLNFKGLSRRWIALIMILSLLVMVTGVVAQAPDPDTTVVVPQVLDRLSWGAVIAGAILALIIQLALNLLGISIGVSTINPQYHESAEPKTLATNAALWLGVSTLIALFFGGWIAARFAGIPNNLDGVLHGLLTWAIVMLVTVLFLLSTLGRIMSGLSTVMSYGLSLAGQVTQGVVHGVTDVAKGVAGTAQEAVQSVANSAQDKVQDVARTVQNTNTTQMPDLSFDSILNEARQLMAQAGVNPEQVKAAASDAVQDAKEAVKDVAQNPAQAEQILSRALSRVLRSGQQVISDVDRQSAIDVMVAQTGMTPAQARETLARWERTYQKTAQYASQMRDQVVEKVEEVRDQAEQKVKEVRQDVERSAREAAQDVTEAIARLAGVLFAAIVIGAVAAGIGGALGTPHDLPASSVQVDVNTPGS